nr:ribonuclease H-like domain-containing protein [Tanacetum cinerariifolium]GEW60987.1 ribonuclease H-like domain-containing protein [Tanacetum cinerariifolium]
MVETGKIDPKIGKPKKIKGQASSSGELKLEKLKKHSHLIRLMQFLMGVDEVYASVRSNIFIIDPIPNVKSAFATLSRDESHRNSNAHNDKYSSSAFVARSNNDWFMNRNNQNIRNPKVNNPKASVNNVSACNSGASSTHTLTNDESNKLRNLLKSSGSIGSFKLTENFIIHDLLMVLGYHDSVQKSLIGTGSMIGGLYYLDHGHPYDQVLSVLKNKIDLSDMYDGPCKVYRKAKQTRELFPLSDHKTTDLGLYGLPSVVLSSRSPYKLVYKSEPNLSHLRDSTCKDDVTMPRSEGKPGSAKSASTEGSTNQNVEPTTVLVVAADTRNNRASTSGKSVQDTNIFSNIENTDTLGSITAGGNLYQNDATFDDENYNSEGEDFC